MNRGGIADLLLLRSKNVAKVAPLIQNFNQSQRSQYLTHIHWRMLDLVFDSSNSNIVSVYTFIAVSLIV